MINKINELADYIVENACFEEWKKKDTSYILHTKELRIVVSIGAYQAVGIVMIAEGVSIHRDRMDIKILQSYTGKPITNRGIKKCLDKCRELFDAELEKRK